MVSFTNSNLEARSLVQLFQERVKLGAHRPALRERKVGRWHSTTWGEWNQRSRAVAAWLLERGIAPGDRVALLCSTRQVWFELDLAILMTGAVTVSLYPSMAPQQHQAQLQDAGARWVFLENPMMAAHFEQNTPPSLEGFVVIDRRGVAQQPDLQGRRSMDLDELYEQAALPLFSLEEVLAIGQSRLSSVEEELNTRIAKLSPASPASIVYSSGTDGEPKGVLLTHDNFLFETEALARVFSLGADDEQLLFLPMAHVFARILEMAQLRSGYLTTFSEGSSHLFRELSEIEPTFIGAVPRFFEQFHVHLLRSIEHQRLERAAIQQAIQIGIEMDRKRRLGAPIPLTLSLQHRTVEKLVLKKIRGAFGRRLRFAFSGGAAMALPLSEWFLGLGVPVLEGYGLTETTSATHVNLPGAAIPGSVGPALPGVEAKISREQEILVRGRCVCAGYWNRPDLTEQMFDAEGWFHTGDEGVIEEGKLKIVGRKKDLLVTSGGHKIAPQPIEAALQQSKWIQKAVIVGEGRPFLTALLSLREETTQDWARTNDQPEEMDALAHSSALRTVIQEEIDHFNTKLASYEKIRDFVILEGALTIGEREITPTGKLRRDRILERFHQDIEAMYG